MEDSKKTAGKTAKITLVLEPEDARILSKYLERARYDMSGKREEIADKVATEINKQLAKKGLI